MIFKFIYPKVKLVKSAYKVKEILKKKIFYDKNFYWLYVIPNGSLYSTTVHDTAYLYKNALIKEPSYQYRYKKNNQIINGSIKQNFVLKSGTPKLKKNIKGVIFSLLCGGAAKNNYWHWLFDVLPKLAILEKSKLKYKPNYYLLPSYFYKFQKQTIKNLGISTKKILDGRNNRHLSSEKIIITDHPIVRDNNPTKSIQNIPRWIIKWLREKFIKKKKFTNYKNIFIDREKNSYNESRDITNLQQVKKLFNSYNFKIVKLSNYSFTKQVQIFHSADCVAGIHGAGFANIVFCRKKTKIIELCSNDSGNVIKKLANKCSLTYYSINEKNIEKKLKYQNFSITVNLKKLEKLLQLKQK